MASLLYRWNYFARKKTGSSMICVPRSCCAEHLCGATKMSRKMGMALLMKGQPSVPEHKLKAYELGFWDPEKCRWTNSHKNIINPFLESSTLLIMTLPEIVESKDLLWGRTCAVDNVRASRKGVLGKLYEIQISPERGLRNSLNFPSYFGMEYVRPWNMGKKLLDKSSKSSY